MSVDAILEAAIGLSCDEQFALAKKIAANIGYELVPEQMPKTEWDRVNRTFYQSYELAGYRAKVSIEWGMPASVDAESLPAWRLTKAEDEAASILAFGAPKTRAIVQAMRGATK